MIERNPEISTASCGMPYAIAGTIENRADLDVMTPEKFTAWFDVTVMTLTEAVSIDAAAHTVLIRDLTSGAESSLGYTKLILSPGAQPIVPPLPGLRERVPHVLCLRNLADMDKIIAGAANAQSVTVVGGGFIGIEVAEAMVERGVPDVHLVEMAPQILMPFDKDMAVLLEREMTAHGVTLHLGDGLKGVLPADAGSDLVCVVETTQTRIPTDLVVLAIGVIPETSLARSAGCEIVTAPGPARGRILCDETMATSVTDIYAVGDAATIRHIVDGSLCGIALAGPAGRQARVAAYNCTEGAKPGATPKKFAGAQGTSIIRVFGLCGAATGVNTRWLEATRTDKSTWDYSQLHSLEHVSYFPAPNGDDVPSVHMKLIFDTTDGRILGAQAVGVAHTYAAARQIDICSAMIQKAGTVDDLAEFEPCYSPPYGAPKMTVNFLGMQAQNMMSGYQAVAQPEASYALAVAGEATLLDVRGPDEATQCHLPHSVFIPLAELRKRLDEIPKDKPVHVLCAAGKRAHIAARALAQRGYQTVVVAGGCMCVRRSAVSTECHGVDCSCESAKCKCISY
eukprot:gnl/Ergobibamus_cyprinoides/480.p1 GENE.gnl/Ergobibamus_cyprinoides/480~~gnl/Ergobibamus_cyprinoides/480.p1  ORF type:complete len:567 (+),score=195.33 gnl/Ergobibamus_cyprinoides/480:116-1816(+)